MSDYYCFMDFETNGLNITRGDVPIEIGILLTDDEYNILSSFEAYINPFSPSKEKWDDYELAAHKVHMIPFTTIKDEGQSPEFVINEIQKLINQQNGVDKTINRYIIMSDNGQFEYNAMKCLYDIAGMTSKFPFHHAAWDINILINSVQKVAKGRYSHKAIQDVFKTYKAVIRALERNGFRKWEK